ncbi:MAG: polysaccharide deacetylase family protein [Fibrobacterota bacterium]
MARPLIRQCVWCKKILKAGEYRSIHNEAFCGDTCQSEWQTRQSIIHRKVDWQKAPIALSGIKVGEMRDNAAPEAPIALPTSENAFKAMTVAEFLEGRTDAEIEELAERLAARNRPRFRWRTPYNIAVATLVVVFAALLLFLNNRKNSYYTIALANKRNTEKLAGTLDSLHAATVPVDTAGLTLLFPSDGHAQKPRNMNISGQGPDSMAVTLIVNRRVRATKKIGEGRFLFDNVRLDEGRNTVTVKGVDAADKVCERSVTVWAGASRDSLSAYREVTPLPFSRQIDYSSAQPLVPNLYAEHLNFSRGDFHKKWIALTFDGAGHSQETEAILDTLRDRGVKATMFMTRGFILNNLAKVRRMDSEGHVIGNHTSTHPHLTTLEQNGLQETSPGVTQEFLARELNGMQEVCDKNSIPLPRIWRAPYGEQNRAINAWGEALGYRHIGWTQGTTWRTTMDTNDWVVAPGDKGFFYPQEVLQKLLQFGKGTEYGLNGGIILMHLGTLRKEGKMVTALGTLIDSLKNRGYEFVTVPQMLDNARPASN